MTRCVAQPPSPALAVDSSPAHTHPFGAVLPSFTLHRREQSKRSDLRLRLELWMREDDLSVVEALTAAIKREVPAFRHGFRRKTEDRK